jgi:DNA (cytosine-5)-methyltransferase 1
VTLRDEQPIDCGRSFFERDENRLTRVWTVNGDTYSSTIDTFGLEFPAVPESCPKDLADWWWASLQGITPTASESRGTLRVAELFCGPGGLAHGVSQFCNEAGYVLQCVAAADSDSDAVDVYSQNHGPLDFLHTGLVSDLVAYEIAGNAENATWEVNPELTPKWSDLKNEDPIDLLIAGPPCEGHSNLNNHSRRKDKRNASYLDVPALAVALDIPVVIIENVPAAVHDHGRVVQTASRLLQQKGYQVTEGVLKAASMGWPQARSRFFMVARKDTAPLPLEVVAEILSLNPEEKPLSAWWAIGDLESIEPDEHMHRTAAYEDDTVERLEYLHSDEGKASFDLPPERHNKMHRPSVRKKLVEQNELDPEDLETTYRSVYGRMDPKRPAGTITTGFMTPGRGRYVHPTQKRTINPREAARLQGFPDDYRFTINGSPPTSRLLTKWIGDAVPLPLGYGAALAALAPGHPRP